MTAGYSDTPLVRKLGGKENQRVGVLGDPGHFYSLAEPLPTGAKLGPDPRLPCPVLMMLAPGE